jgi:predicted site-specific integrase-resolvase
MTDETNLPSAQLEPHRRYAERRGVSTRTLDRWTDAGILPAPVRINGRKYWPTDVEPRHDGEPAA